MSRKDKKIDKKCIRERIKECISYYVFPSRDSMILFGVLIVIGLILGGFYHFEKTERYMQAEELVVHMDQGKIDLKMDFAQEQESSAWIGLYSEFWGSSMAVIIFLLEICRNYKYGLSLKRIVNFAIGPFVMVFTGGYYVLLCFAAYYCESMYQYKTLIAIIFFSFGIFGMAIIFWVKISTRSYILKLVKRRSKQQIRYIRERFFSEEIPRLNDALLLREVIEHTNYSNISEWGNMVEIIGGCISDQNVNSCLTGTLAEHTILKAVANHIIYKSGVESEYAFNRTVDILDELLKNLFQGMGIPSSEQLYQAEEEEEQEREQEKKSISFILQVMLPLLDYNSYNSIRAFLNLWERYKQYQMDVISYVYLYLYYKGFYESNISQENWEMIYQNKSWKFCMEHCNCWNVDQELALELWMDWEQYNGDGRVRGLIEFYDFMDKLQHVRVNPNEDIDIIVPEYLRRGHEE